MDNGFAEGYAVGQGNNGYNNGGMWGGDWWAIIILFALFGWGGNGFGWGGNGGGNCLSRGDLCQDMNFNNLDSAVRSLQSGLCDGFYAQNTTMLQGFNGIQNSLCQGFNATDRAVSDLGFRLQDCCCTLGRQIDGVNYNMAKNTCDITNAINGSTQQILGYLCNEKISALQSENALLTAQLSQNSQTNTIINALRPVATPAYLTCSPFESAYGFGRNGYGYNNSCGCGCGCGCNG